MDQLPRDIFPVVLATASPQDILAFCQTHKRAYGDVCQNPTFWRVLIKTRWGNILKSGDAQEYATRYHSDSLELFEAINNNDLAYFNSLLDRGVDIEVQDKYHYTPLGWAIKTKANPIAYTLIAEGADVNKGQSNQGYTPLHLAVIKQDLALIKDLLDAGADVNRINVRLDGKIKGFISTPLTFGAMFSKLTPELVQLLLDYGATLEIPYGAWPGFLFYTTLSPQVVDVLLDYIEDINIQDERGNTALMIHARANQDAIVKLLLDAGADIHIKNYQGQTALDIAMAAGAIESIKLLIEAEADQMFNV